MLSRGAASAAAVNQSLPAARRRRLQHGVRKWFISSSTAQARGAKTPTVLCSLVPTAMTVLPTGAPRSGNRCDKPTYQPSVTGAAAKASQQDAVSRSEAGEAVRASLRAAGGVAVSSRIRCIARPPFESLEATVVHTLPLRQGGRPVGAVPETKPKPPIELRVPPSAS